MYLRTIKLIVSVFFCSLSVLPAQNIVSSDPVRTAIDRIFEHIDKNQIPSGYLYEYSKQEAKFDNANGIIENENWIDLATWKLMYGTLKDAQINGQSSFPELETLNIQLDAYSSDEISLPILFMDYHILKQDAIEQNLLYAIDNQLYDVPNRVQSPYLAKNAFAVASTKNVCKDGLAKFVFRPELFYTNTNQIITKLEADFDDGKGYQILNWQSPVSAFYTAKGTKHLRYRITFNSGITKEGHSYLQVLKPYQNNPNARYGNAINAGTIILGATAEHSGCFARIHYSAQNIASESVTKPLIVLEGFDPSARVPDLASPYEYDDFLDEMNEIRNSNFNFNQSLDDIAGYDLIFIDFTDGADDIRRNAIAFQQVLRLVNERKTAHNGVMQQNVVIGISMGGLIARYGLADMVRNGENTQTRLLITHDTPHRGANIPLGLQGMILGMERDKFLRERIPELSQSVTLLNTPATQQMMILRATNGIGNYVSNNFLNNEYRAMVTLNTPYKLIATSLGSECGIPVTTAGKKLFQTWEMLFLMLYFWEEV